MKCNKFLLLPRFLTKFSCRCVYITTFKDGGDYGDGGGNILTSMSQSPPKTPVLLFLVSLGSEENLI